jgi:D-3-phosphoglycerate dehydrogenase / 2-oxoglutarate reductase
MNCVFVDATPALASLADELLRVDGMALRINRDPDVCPESLPGLLAGARVAIIDHAAADRHREGMRRRA